MLVQWPRDVARKKDETLRVALEAEEVDVEDDFDDFDVDGRWPWRVEVLV